MSELKYKFPEGFLWGSATSGPQCEGAANVDGRTDSVWDIWFRNNPECFFDGVGPKDTSTFYKNYKTDIAMAKEVGHNSLRTSIQWTRLIPERDGQVNQRAVDFYNGVIDTMIENGIEPMLCLYHFDMPAWAYEIGGWENKEVVEAYAKYAEIAFTLFGDRVRYWQTFNEPCVPVEGGYLYGFHLPLVRDGKRAAVVAYHTQLASSKAIERFRILKSSSVLPKDAKIGIILNLSPTYPRSEDEADVAAANACDLFFNRSFLDPSIKGEYPPELVDMLKESDALPETLPEDLYTIKNNTIDFLGVNYYQPRRAKAREVAFEEDVFTPDKYFEPYQMPGAKMNPYRGWEIYEKGVYDIAVNLRKNYGNISFYVSENGMGVEGEEAHMDDNGSVNDQYRIDFIKDHLRWLNKAINEGSNCFGYHLWTFIDCWSWTNAYKNRYGFIGLDLKTQKRTIKASGHWYNKMTADNGFN